MKKAYQNDMIGHSNGLMVLDLATGQKTNVYGYLAFEPEWSPDGSKILFSEGKIYEVNPDGTGLVNLSGDQAGNHHNPEYSPSGDEIVYDVYDYQSTNKYSVTKMNQDGSDKTTVDQSNYRYTLGDWGN